MYKDSNKLKKKEVWKNENGKGDLTKTVFTFIELYICFHHLFHKN